ncbi:hypothetical protein GDO81_016653 [Engystomops pustulosus]|uniref:EGF-like domain-containing protein n=1 Tax=Engystomops pustulosus TaxID=76066 RepID=A0AAV7ACA8_ENGPU|nr:hypothetical protein GDO81_016653 [Engystomops pustulosus]
MIRFLLLLVLLPGAELFANDTDEVETSTATTLGSQFTMAVPTQTTIRKPLGTHAPTKKTAVKNAHGGIRNITNVKHKNTSHDRDINVTQNTTHWHPTKMPGTAKSHLQRESSIKKPIIKKVTTPPTKFKSMMKTTMKNPSARYQSPPHVHHKNTTTRRPGMGHYHHSNASAGAADLAKSHRVVTPPRNNVKPVQKVVTSLPERVKHLPLGSHHNKHLKDQSNITTLLLSSVISNSTKSLTHEVNHITDSLPKTSFVHEKKTVLHELNALNTSEHLRRAENASLVPQIHKDLSIAGVLKGIHLPGVRQSEVLQGLNVRVPDRNVIYNRTKQNLGDPAKLVGLGRDGTIHEMNRVSTVESVETGTVVNSTSGMGDTPMGHTQSEVQAHNNVEQQFQTQPEMTTGGHLNHNQTHSHRHHKHSALGGHKQSDNTVPHHTVTSPGRVSGPHRHHLKHLHNSTHPHEHNEHWLQHQISSTQVYLDETGTRDHQSQPPLQSEKVNFHESPPTIKNRSDVSTLSLQKDNFSEAETSTANSWKHFTTVEPQLTTQRLQNLTTISQVTMQTQLMFTTPITTHIKTGPQEEILPSPYHKTVTQDHLISQSIYNTTEEFHMELTTDPQMTPHENTEVVVHRSHNTTEIESTTQSHLKIVEETKPGEPSEHQPDLSTHKTSYQSTWTYPGLLTETRTLKVGSATETWSPITETRPHPFKVTKSPLTTHSPPALVTLKDFNETQAQISINIQYSEPITSPHSRTEPRTRGQTETLTETESTVVLSTTQTGPRTKGNSKSTSLVFSTETISWTQSEPTTKDKTEPITKAEPTTSSQIYSVTPTESTTKTMTSWLGKTQTTSTLQTEPNTTNINSISPIYKEMSTEPPTQHVPKHTSTMRPSRSSTTPSWTFMKNETDSVTSTTEPLNQTSTMGYGRDETESPKQTDPTSTIPLNLFTPHGHVSSTHREHLPSTQTQPDLETRTYPHHTTRARTEMSSTVEPGTLTEQEHMTSSSGGPVTSYTTEGPWSEVSSPSLSGGHQSHEDRWDSGPTLSTTRSHTSDKGHSSDLTTSPPTKTKVVTSPQSSTSTTQTPGEMMSMQPGRDRIFIVDEQQPVFKVPTINVTYKMNVSHLMACEQPHSCKALLLQELTSAYKSSPGFDKIDIVNVTMAGSTLEYKAVFSVRPGSLMSATQELVLSNPSGLFGSLTYRLYNTTLTDYRADPCTDWFVCPRSFQCVPLRRLSALCVSPCHSIFCHNNGICIHRKGQDPECQCPIGRDFWYMGQTCDYRMTHHRLAAIACAVVFCIIICAAVAVFILVRRFQTQILQQKVAQTQSSYRRFSRFDDVPTHFWCPSQTWLTASASLNSLDNPAFSSSEEVFPLQALGSCVCGCQDGARSGSQTNQPQQPTRAPPRLETSCSSVNDLMVDSGKASDVSVCSWPMEPIHWTPFPILHQLSLQSPFHARRPHSYFEGMELVNTERSWTA